MFDAARLVAFMHEALQHLDETNETGVVRDAVLVVEIQREPGAPSEFDVMGTDDRDWLARKMLEVTLDYLEEQEENEKLRHALDDTDDDPLD